MAPLSTPLAGSTFNLNSAGVAGFFGGKEAISAMATVHLYQGRRWLGWFNSPGSYTIAKRFGRMANNRFWDGLFPGPNDSPAITFGLDGKKGPQYIAALSGTTMKTGHLAHLTMERGRNTEGHTVHGRETIPIGVSYLAMKHVDYKKPVKCLPVTDALLGLFPIIISIGTCVMCALVYDWFGFSMILLGIISSGLASLVIGKGKLVIRPVKPALGVPAGHGILMGDDEVVVIKGAECDVNAITKGRFDLETSSKRVNKEKDTQGGQRKSPDSQPNGELKKGADSKHGRKKKKFVGSYHDIGVCSLLLIVQFLLQLLLIPQGTLFGQIMFLISLVVSWGYNSYLSSLEKEKIQTDLLFQALGDPEMIKFCVGTRTTMTVFVCLLLFHGVKRSSSEKADVALREKILHSCVSNDTPVWNLWRHKVARQLLSTNNDLELLRYPAENDDENQAFQESDIILLNQLLEDAKSAFKGYLDVRDSLPGDSSSSG